MTTAEERTRVLEKIQKCLRLSKSSEAHEAAAALRQAQKMMERHGIDEAELNSAGYGCDAVETPIPARNKLPLFMSKLTHLITRTFGVTVVIERYLPEKGTRLQYRMRYWGPKDRVAVAVYAHTVVFRAANAAWAAALKAEPELATRRNARLNFRMAWLDAVTGTVEAMGATPEELAATELIKTKHYGKELEKAKTNTSGRADYVAQAKGAKAAEGFSLNRPMSGSAQRKLGNG